MLANDETKRIYQLSHKDVVKELKLEMELFREDYVFGIWGVRQGRRGVKFSKIIMDLHYFDIPEGIVVDKMDPVTRTAFSVYQGLREWQGFMNWWNGLDGERQDEIFGAWVKLLGFYPGADIGLSMTLYTAFSPLFVGRLLVVIQGGVITRTEVKDLPHLSDEVLKGIRAQLDIHPLVGEEDE